MSEPITPTYDSTADTLKHKAEVNKLLLLFATEIMRRAVVHDDTKLEEPEKSLFDKYTPLLAGLTYGSPEYKAMLEKLDPALQHHYARSTHHPEHFPNGIAGMDLADLVEMFMDWVASSRRQHNGNIRQSIVKSQDRFKFPDELKTIFINTIPMTERK